MKLLDVAPLAIFAIAALAVPALAAEPQPAPAPATAASAPAAPASAATKTASAAQAAKPKPKIKRICTDDPVVGTRVSKIICKDVEVTEEEHYYGKEARQRMTDVGAIPTTPIGN